MASDNGMEESSTEDSEGSIPDTSPQPAETEQGGITWLPRWFECGHRYQRSI
jgi:hypothetical protein